MMDSGLDEAEREYFLERQASLATAKLASYCTPNCIIKAYECIGERSSGQCPLAFHERKQR